jgi:hypothetical protein
MITTEEKEKIITVLGIRYSRKVLMYLSEKGVTNKTGAPFSLSMIRQVMNAETNHDEIESAIFELAAATDASKKATKKNRKQILDKI